VSEELAKKIILYAKSADFAGGLYKKRWIYHKKGYIPKGIFFRLV